MKERVLVKLPDSEHHIDYRYQGLPVSQEALFLARFVHLNVPRIKSGVDLGCGCGILSIAISAYRPGARMTGIDIQTQLIEIARENAQRNPVCENLEFVSGDIRTALDLPLPASQDLVIANPPFRKQNTGLVSPEQKKSIACHELSAELSDYAFAASHLLRHHAVFGSVIIPERLMEYVIELKRRQLEPYWMQCIHHSLKHPANSVLLLSRKNGKSTLKVAPPLLIRLTPG